jgi:hypothetical protein
VNPRSSPGGAARLAVNITIPPGDGIILIRQ